MNEWRSAWKEDPPTYVIVEVRTIHGVEGKAQYLGHHTYSMPEPYPILGSCVVTH